MAKLICKLLDNNNNIIYNVDGFLNIEFSSRDRGNISESTDWGIYANSGNFEFIDNNSTFLSVAERIESICIYYSALNKEKLLATFLIEDYEYDYETKKVNVKLKDSILGLQTSHLGEYYPFHAETLLSIYNKNISSFANITNESSNKMSNTHINTSYMDKSTKWSAINKICQASMLRCFSDVNGRPLITDETPRQNNHIIIKPKNIISIENYISSKKTKVEKVSISAKKINKHENEPLFEDTEVTCWNVIDTIDTDADGIKDNISVSWGGTNNVYRVLTGDGYHGINVGATNKLPDHTFRFRDVVASTLSRNIGNYGRLESNKISTEDGTFTPSRSNASILPNTPDEVDYYFETWSALQRYYFDNEGRLLAGSWAVTNASINLLGDFFTEDGEETFGNDEEDSLSLQSNELIQTQSTYYNQNLSQHIIDTVKKKYSNGFICVEMEVICGNYKDSNNEDIISPTSEKPLFEKYDIVTPFVIRNGIEQPYAKKTDGTAMSFKIIGIDYRYKGFLRQKLYLQEYVDFN